MKHIKKFSEFLNENLNEKKSKSDYEGLMGELESKIWELKNSKKSWIPEDPAKRDKMIASYQKKFDAAKKKFDAFLDENLNEYELTDDVKVGQIVKDGEADKYEVIKVTKDKVTLKAISDKRGWTIVFPDDFGKDIEPDDFWGSLSEV